METRQPRNLAVNLDADALGWTALAQKKEYLGHTHFGDGFRGFSNGTETYAGMSRETRAGALVAEFERA